MTALYPEKKTQDEQYIICAANRGETTTSRWTMIEVAEAICPISYCASYSSCHVNYHVLTFDVTCLYFPFSEHCMFQGFSVRSARYESIRENSGSEVDLVDCRHVILEVHHAVKR